MVCHRRTPANALGTVTSGSQGNGHPSMESHATGPHHTHLRPIVTQLPSMVDDLPQAFSKYVCPTESSCPHLGALGTSHPLAAQGRSGLRESRVSKIPTASAVEACIPPCADSAWNRQHRQTSAMSSKDVWPQTVLEHGRAGLRTSQAEVRPSHPLFLPEGFWRHDPHTHTERARLAPAS